MKILTVKDVSVRFDTVTVLDHVDFAIEQGQYVGLIGPNGAGKSTLLKVILGLVRPSQGLVKIAPDVRIGYVPQKYTLPAHVPLSVQEVIHMGRHQSMMCTSVQHQEVLALVGLDASYNARSFHTLSGGQKQRVIIARALLAQPQILLFDEPLSGVDHATKMRIYDLLALLNKERGITILFVSHDVERVVAQCDRVLCLDHALHSGCHPMAFAQGERAPQTCLAQAHHPVKDAPNATLHPVHHHHKESSYDH